MASIAVLAAPGFVLIRHLVDFPVYYAAGRSLLSGRTDLYAPDFALGPTMDYRYPPLFLVSLSPLWRLPYGAAAYVWHVLGIAATLACGWTAIRALSWSRLGVTTGAVKESMLKTRSVRADLNGAFTIGLGVLAVAQYYVMALHYGNAQLLVTALLLLSLVLAASQRSVTAGALLAAAITIKITPALFLIYFGWRRRWKTIVATLGLLVVFNLLPALYFGFSKNAELIGTWYRHVLVDQELHEINGPINLSLKGQLVRLFTRVDYSQRVDGDTGYPAVNIADYSYRAINRLWLPLDFALLALGLVVISIARRRSRQASLQPQAAVARSPFSVAAGVSPDQKADAIHGKDAAGSDENKVTALEAGIMVCLMLLVEPLTSKIYFVALIWPIVTLLGVTRGEGSSTPRWLRWGISLVIVTNVGLPLLPGRAVQRLLLVSGVDFYLTCLILLMLVWAALRQRPSGPNWQLPRSAPSPAS